MSDVRHAWADGAERIDRALQTLGAVRSRNAAQRAIAAGLVRIDGLPVTKAGTKVQPGQEIHVTATNHYVSRGAHKLITALDVFGIGVAGRLTLDVGASTGGFTQVLLERGAHRVLAVDVGHGQMVPELRAHDRVRLWEGCNARYLTYEALTEHTGERTRPSLIVGDLSFISLTHVLPALVTLIDDTADLVLLIKPQFEVGREGIGGGVVSDPALQLAAIRQVVTAASDLGLGISGLTESPILGGHGNREFLIHMTNTGGCDDERLHEMMTEVVYGEGS